MSASISTVLILMPFNTAFIPFDKLLLPVFVALLLATNNWSISKNLILSFFVLFAYVVLSTVLNFGQNDVLVFYPVLFGFAAVLASENKYITVKSIKRALMVNILFGLFMVFLFYLGVASPFVNSLVEKGVPFMVAPLGFSPTIQVYGTCCCVWLFLTFESRKQNAFLILMVVLALLLTLNRASLLLLFVMLFFYRRKIFYFLSAVLVILSAAFWEIVQFMLFSSSTLDSRVQLRRGAEISYWESTDWVTLFLGKANHQTTETIAQRTFWERSYIENGVDFLAHSYGFFGLLIYAILLYWLLVHLVKLHQYKLAILSGVYLMVTQFLTAEFLASSFMFFLMSVLVVSKSQKQPL